MKLIGIFSVCIYLFAGATDCYSRSLPRFTQADIKSSAEKFSVNASFSGSLGYTDRPITHFKNFLHIEFPDAKVRGGVKNYPVAGDSLVESVILVQYTPSTVRMRIVLKEDAASYVEKFKISVDRNVAHVDVEKPLKTTEQAATKPTVSDVPEKEAVVEPNSIDRDKDALLPVLVPVKGDEFVYETVREPKVEKPIDPLIDRIADTKDDKAEFITARNLKNPLLDSESTDFSEIRNIFSGRLVLSLGFILLLIVGLALVYRKVTGAFNFGAKSANMGIKVISTQTLAPKKSLAVVNIGERYFLIGVAADTISLISEVDKNGEQQLGELKPENPRDQKMNFNDQLKQNLFKAKSAQPARGASYNGKERLMEMAKLSDMIRDKVSMIGVK